MFKGDAGHTGYTEEKLNYPLKLAWKHLTNLSVNNPSSPAVADGIIYFCSASRLYAVNAETGSLKWRYPAEEVIPGTIKSSPLVGEDLIYFGGGDGRLYAIKKEDGSLAWSFVTKGTMSSSPVLYNDIVYVGSGDDHLYALDAQTGKPKWPGGFRTRDDVSGSPAVVEGLVCFMSNDMILYGAHASTGKTKWAIRVGASGVSTSPIVSENTVYLAVGNAIQAYQAMSGRMKWGIPLSSDVSCTPAAANGIIYVGCRDGKLYALTSVGKLKWKKPVDLGGSVTGSPIIAGDTVIAGGAKGALIAVDAETGEVKWTYQIMPSSLDYGKLKYVNVTAAPAISNGMLYVLADDGTLHAFRYDAPDETAPMLSTVRPTRDSLMPGAPPIEVAAIVTDPGSGINWNTLSFTLDDTPIQQKDPKKNGDTGYAVIPERGVVYYKTAVTQPIEPLSDGLHTVSMSVSDWLGNKLDTKWCFTVDNKIRRQPKDNKQKQQGNTGPEGLGIEGTETGVPR